MLKIRNSLLVTLTAVIVLVATTYAASLADVRDAKSGASSTQSVMAKPGALPTTGEPEAGGGGAPLPKNEVPRMGMLLIPDLDPELFWRWLVQWLTDMTSAQHPQRGR
jgi:hypothetical protein